MDEHKALDLATFAGAGVAAVSFWQGVALGVTIIAGVISIICGLVRLYDRFHRGEQ